MRFVNLEDCTYKDFKEWCLDKEMYGYWTYDAMYTCYAILDTINKLPFWKKKKVWERAKYEFFAEDVVFDILEPEEISAKIRERKAKVLDSKED